MVFFGFGLIILLLILMNIFLSPFIGMCLILILGFLFFIILKLWIFIFIPILIIIGPIFLIYYLKKKYTEWKKIPTINEYLVNNPQCKIDNGMICYNCSSGKLENRGLFFPQNKLRFYTCKQCGTILYRFKIL